MLPWVKITGHDGIQRINGIDAGFNDYRIGLHTNWKRLDSGFAMVGTDVDEA